MSRRIIKQCPQPECAQKLFNEREIFSHYKIEHMLTQLVCAECFSGFDAIEDLSNHFGKFHPILSEFRYIDADVKGDGYNYRGYEILERKSAFIEQKPMPIHERLKCCLCNDAFKTVALLQLHCIISHDGKFVTCSRCQTPFKSIFCLKEHSGYCLQTNRNTSELASTFVNGNVCQVCNEDFANNAEAVQHYTECHLKVKHLCDICPGVNFARKDDLQKHRAEMHMAGTSIKSERGITAKNQKEVKPVILQPDSRTISAKFNQKMCAFCNQRFKTVSDTRDHLMAVHATEIYVCDVCDRGYILYKSLQTHQYSHSAENHSENDSLLDELTSPSEVKPEAKPSTVTFEITTLPKRHIKLPDRYGSGTCDDTPKKMRHQPPQQKTSTVVSGDFYPKSNRKQEILAKWPELPKLVETGSVTNDSFKTPMRKDAPTSSENRKKTEIIRQDTKAKRPEPPILVEVGSVPNDSFKIHMPKDKLKSSENRMKTQQEKVVTSKDKKAHKTSKETSERKSPESKAENDTIRFKFSTKHKKKKHRKDKKSSEKIDKKSTHKSGASSDGYFRRLFSKEALIKQSLKKLKSKSSDDRDKMRHKNQQSGPSPAKKQRKAQDTATGEKRDSPKAIPSTSQSGAPAKHAETVTMPQLYPTSFEDILSSAAQSGAPAKHAETVTTPQLYPTSFEDILSSAARLIETVTSPPKLPDMPVLMEEVVLPKNFTKSPVLNHTVSANKNREEMPLKPQQQKQPMNTTESTENVKVTPVMPVSPAAPSSVRSIQRNLAHDHDYGNTEKHDIEGKPATAHANGAMSVMSPSSMAATPHGQNEAYLNTLLQNIFEEGSTTSAAIPQEQNATSSAHRHENISLPDPKSCEPSTVMSNEQQTEKSDADSGYASIAPHTSAVPNTSGINIKKEYDSDSDSDVEFISQYHIAIPQPLAPPPTAAQTEFQDLTDGPEAEWELFISSFTPGDVDIKPIIKKEKTDS